MNYHNITRDDMLNGDGLRVVLWGSGCEHHCRGCQNPITWDPQDGVFFDQKAKEELFKELEKSYISGITFSGGDPLFPSNEPEITRLAKEIRHRFPEKNIWLYTGYTWEQIKEKEVVKVLDVLVDGTYMEELRNTQLHWRGSSNQRVIAVQESLKTEQIVLHDE